MTIFDFMSDSPLLSILLLLGIGLVIECWIKAFRGKDHE
jgi:hypothetical protein